MNETQALIIMVALIMIAFGVWGIFFKMPWR